MPPSLRSAIGNTATVDVKGGVFVEGNQKNYASVTAKQGALVLGAKKVELTAAAIGNATNVDTSYNGQGFSAFDQQGFDWDLDGVALPMAVVETS